jgi:N-methylhydantoinase B/oxoprolinase/acetone carboxylase alpha subunit
VKVEERTERVGQAEDFDPILLAVIANRFDAIVREMTNTLFRSGRSAVLNMARDFSCGLLTSQDQLLATAEGLQVHLLGTGLQTPYMRKYHPDMAEGDAYLHNDPYLGNTHTADHTILVPIFIDGEHMFTASAKAHQADCGNSQATTYMAHAVDIYEEAGLNFPCVRVQRGYADVDDVIRMCRRRIRVPDMWYGDYLAALGAARIAERRVKELVAKYGRDLIARFIVEWLNYSERRADHAIRQLPSGRLIGNSAHDPLPMVPEGIPIKVIVDVDSEDGRIAVDLTQNPDCVPAGVNLSEACARSSAMIGVFNCLDPGVPRNAGSFRRVDVKLRENCVVGIPRFPHSCSTATTNLTERVINATQSAFALIGEGWGLAEGGGACGVGYAVVSGKDFRRGGAPFVNELINGNNGGPASPWCDGWITFSMPDGAFVTYVDSIEITEQKYPIHFRSLRLLCDSGGPGRFRGGPSGELVYGPKRDPIAVFYFADFAHNPAQGVWGGMPGSLAQIHKLELDGRETPRPTIGDTTLSLGEWIKGTEAGGGGYGDPLQRDPEMVRKDVLERWVSIERAQSSYGVVLVGEGESMSVNVPATVALRRRMTRKRTQPGDRGRQ